MFNHHESPRRREPFLARKVIRAVAAIRAGQRERGLLGRRETRWDRGYAPEYVEGMWLLLQREGRYLVFGRTGETHSARGVR